MNKVNNIIIFVGGKGTRLGKITKKIPKPLIKFNKIEFLDYQIQNLLKLRPKKIILLCAYKYKLFEKKYKNKIYNKTKIICVREKKLLGTGGSLYHAREHIINNTLVCNGDTYFDYDLSKITKIKFKELFIFLVKNNNYKSNNKLSNLCLKNKIVIVKNKAKYMNSGFYLISKKFRQFLKKGTYSLENNIIEDLISEKKVEGKIIKGNHIDIGTKKNLKYFQKFCKGIKIKI